MAFRKTSGTVSSLSDLFARIRTFFVGSLGWTQVHSGTQMGSAYYFYHSTGEAGNKDIYIGVRSFRRSSTLCGFQFTACTDINTSEDFDSQPGGFGTPDCCCCQFVRYPILSAVDDGTSMAYWFIGDKDFAFLLFRIGSKYLSAYVGLINSYWSDYPLPLVVLGSLTFDPYLRFGCTSVCWRDRQLAIPYRRNLGSGEGYDAFFGCCGSWLRNCGNTEWFRRFVTNCVDSYNNCEFLSHTNSCWWLVTYFYCQSYSTRSQGHVLFPIYVGSPEIDLLGELKYVYYSYFYGNVPSESTIYVGGDPYLVFVSTYGEDSVSIAIRDYE